MTSVPPAAPPSPPDPRPGSDSPAVRGQDRKLSEALGFGASAPGVSVQIGAAGTREPKKAFTGERAAEGADDARSSSSAGSMFGTGLAGGGAAASRPTGANLADRLVSIPAGTWLTGEDKRVATLPAFQIDRDPVTHGDYEVFVLATGHRAPLYWRGGRCPEELRDHPVVGVDYFDAVAYARWAQKDLPFEDEWERAARGTDGRTFPWGDEPDLAANTARTGVRSTIPVGFHPKNTSPDGCRDMVGNVWELTHTPAQGGGVVVRGGSWFDFALYAKTFFRFASRPDARNGTIGFRCVRRAAPRPDAPRAVSDAEIDAALTARRGRQEAPDPTTWASERRDLVPDFRRLRQLLVTRDEDEAEARRIAAPSPNRPLVKRAFAGAGPVPVIVAPSAPPMPPAPVPVVRAPAPPPPAPAMPAVPRVATPVATAPKAPVASPAVSAASIPAAPVPAASVPTAPGATVAKPPVVSGTPAVTITPPKPSAAPAISIAPPSAPAAAVVAKPTPVVVMPPSASPSPSASPLPAASLPKPPAASAPSPTRVSVSLPPAVVLTESKSAPPPVKVVTPPAPVAPARPSPTTEPPPFDPSLRVLTPPAPPVETGVKSRLIITPSGSVTPTAAAVPAASTAPAAPTGPTPAPKPVASGAPPPPWVVAKPVVQPTPVPPAPWLETPSTPKPTAPVAAKPPVSAQPAPVSSAASPLKVPPTAASTPNAPAAAAAPTAPSSPTRPSGDAWGPANKESRPTSPADSAARKPGDAPTDALRPARATPPTTQAPLNPFAPSGGATVSTSAPAVGSLTYAAEQAASAVGSAVVASGPPSAVEVASADDATPSSLRVALLAMGLLAAAVLVVVGLFRLSDREEATNVDVEARRLGLPAFVASAGDGAEPIVRSTDESRALLSDLEREGALFVFADPATDDGLESAEVAVVMHRRLRGREGFHVALVVPAAPAGTPTSSPDAQVAAVRDSLRRRGVISDLLVLVDPVDDANRPGLWRRTRFDVPEDSAAVLVEDGLQSMRVAPPGVNMALTRSHVAPLVREAITRHAEIRATNEPPADEDPAVMDGDLRVDDLRKKAPR